MANTKLKLGLPPSSVTGESGTWQYGVWRVLNDQPTMSRFSAPSPNSTVTGVAGDLAINVAPSASTRLWIKYGSNTIPSQSNWSGVA